ncbi:AraC family transcriptional regulator [Planctomycetota bacterium]|nr:AraC family transcriptional regulator [Planctomycetota bacterium]
MAERSQTNIEYAKRIHIAMNYISENINRDVRLDDIAARAMFSKYHFHRIFQAMLGETVAEFTRRIRLQTAASLLLNEPNTDITTIALTCGFSSSQNFAKAFRKFYKQSPTELRRSPQNNPFFKTLQNSKPGNTYSNQGNDARQPTEYDFDSLIDFQPSKYRSHNMGIQIKEMPTFRVAYVRTYGLSDETCGKAFEQLFKWAGPRGYAEGTLIGLCWDNPDVTPEDKCRFDACIDIPENCKIEGNISEQEILGGKYAVGRYQIPDSSGFAECWGDIFKWLATSGYLPDEKPCYQIMHSSDDESGKSFLFDICIPVKPL